MCVKSNPPHPNLFIFKRGYCYRMRCVVVSIVVLPFVVAVFFCFSDSRVSLIVL